MILFKRTQWWMPVNKNEEQLSFWKWNKQKNGEEKKQDTILNNFILAVVTSQSWASYYFSDGMFDISWPGRVLVQPVDWKNVETCKETWTCTAMWLLLYISHVCKSSRYGWFPVTYIIRRWVQGSMENLYFNAPITHEPRKWTSGRSITARTWLPCQSLHIYNPGVHY